MANDKPQLRNVLFPVVAPSGVSFETVHVERVEMLDRADRFVQGPGLADTAIEILMDARSGEPKEARLDGVSVVVTGRGFSGKSYGLALAIADKRARALGSAETAVIATGTVVNRGRGVVGPIEGFAAKAQAVVDRAAAADTPIDFAFPQANWDSADTAVRDLLNAAQRDGKLRLRPCREVSDARALWLVQRPGGPRRVMAIAAILLVLVAGSGAGFWYWQGRDARGCEAAMTPQPPATREAIARAVELCERASAAAPQDGRLHYQHGRALTLNGSDELAQSAWRKAAEAGDKDGMASYGRAIWQSDPADPKRVKAAHYWLERASAAGSIGATRDVGYLLLDGAALPPNPEEAQKWFVKAKEMEQRDPANQREASK